ncbi:MAG: hypothetical protein EA415_08525 [Sphaerobacteraceae bacterium]|nr:MAG: hypothetical protein EA415_08525 [Sphaerobacteraceae bacterium]
MAEQYFDHVDQQYPYALIGPLREQVRVLEDRAHHYVHHVRMDDDDRATMEKVHALLEATRAELERLREASGKPTE